MLFKLMAVLSSFYSGRQVVTALSTATFPYSCSRAYGVKNISLSPNLHTFQSPL